MYLKGMFLLSFLGSTSFQIQKKLQMLFSYKLMSFNLKIVFTSPVKVKSFLILKDKVHKMFFSGLFCKYKCGSCNATFCGKNKNPFKVRVFEHFTFTFHISLEKRWRLTTVSSERLKNTSYVATTLRSFNFG